MKEFNIKEVQAVNEKLQVIDPAFLAASPQLCYETAIWCASMRAYTGEMMAIAKQEWMGVKKRAYETFVVSNEANKTKVERYGVMAVKDYIAAKCGDYEARYEYVERTNAALSSMEDVLRSVISAIKNEMYLQGRGEAAA